MNKNLFVEVYTFNKKLGKSYKQDLDSFLKKKIEIFNNRSDILEEFELYTHPAYIGGLCSGKIIINRDLLELNNLILFLKEIIPSTNSYKLRSFIISNYYENNNYVYLDRICAKKGYGSILLNYFIEFIKTKQIQYIELSSTFENITYYPLFNFSHKNSCKDEKQIEMSNELKLWIKNNKPATINKLLKEKLFRDYLQEIRNSETGKSLECKNKNLFEYLNSKECHGQLYKMLNCLEDNVEISTKNEQEEMLKLKLQTDKLNKPIYDYLFKNNIKEPDNESIKLQENEYKLTENKNNFIEEYESIKKELEETQNLSLNKKDLTEEELNLLNNSYTVHPYCSFEFITLLSDKKIELEEEKENIQNLINEYKENPSNELKNKLLEYISDNKTLLKHNLNIQNKDNINSNKILKKIEKIYDEDIKGIEYLLSECKKYKIDYPFIVPKVKVDKIYKKIINNLLNLYNISQTYFIEENIDKWINSHNKIHTKIAKKFINNSTFISFKEVFEYIKDVSNYIKNIKKNYDMVVLLYPVVTKALPYNYYTIWMDYILYHYMKEDIYTITKSLSSHFEKYNKDNKKILYVKIRDNLLKTDDLNEDYQEIDELSNVEMFSNSKLYVITPYVTDIVNSQITENKNENIIYSKYKIIKPLKLDKLLLHDKYSICCEYRYINNKLNNIYFNGFNLENEKTDYILCSNKIINELSNIDYDV
jgi:hypothetical protein